MYGCQGDQKVAVRGYFSGHFFLFSLLFFYTIIGCGASMAIGACDDLVISNVETKPVH